MFRHLARSIALVLAGGLSLAAQAADQSVDPADWPGVLSEAKGQTVYFHAWGGSDNINRYIEWAGAALEDLAGAILAYEGRLANEDKA